MLTNVILGLIATECAAGIVLAYKSLKTIKETKVDADKHNTTIEELKTKVDGASKSINKEIRNGFCEISYTGIKIKEKGVVKWQSLRLK